MPDIGSYEAKTHLSRLLDEVEAGASYVITKHGRAVALLVGVDGPAVDGREVAMALRAARKGVQRGHHSVRDMIDSGRR